MIHGYSQHTSPIHLLATDSGIKYEIKMYNQISRHPALVTLLLIPFISSTSASFPEFLPRAEQTTVVATVTVQPPSVTSIPDTTSYTNAEDLQTDILNSTNFYRYEHNATALAWNASLATYAQSWASHCQWKHSGGPNGENLAAGFPNVTAAVDGWGNERAEYHFTNPTTGFSEATGHFTQLVWKSTTSTGCAAVNCTGKGGMDGFFLVCEYYPPGNVVGGNNAYVVQNVQSQIHSNGPTTGTSSSSGTMATTSTASASAATTTATTTGQNGLGNDGTPGRAARGLWTLAAFVAALALAGGMI